MNRPRTSIQQQRVTPRTDVYVPPKVAGSPFISQAALHPGKLRVIPLGGLGEIGKNMMIYEYERDIIIVDMGIMFPYADMLGIDYIIPDVTYLVERKDRIRGIVFTHGHEDHIGSVPFLLPKLPIPMYCTKLTAALIEAKLQENGIKPDIRIVQPGDVLQLGVFKVEFIPFVHTIPDEVAILLTTPVGKVLHITDFKLDHTDPAARDLYAKLQALGREGIKLLLLDSTNVERSGAGTSERVVTETIGSIFYKAKGRIIVTSFASSIERLQGVVDNAVRFRRKVALSGRSMEKTVNIAMKLGYMRVPDGTLVDVRRISNLPDNEIAILSTGSQGEEYSAMVRMASGEHRHIQIKKGDTIVISASAIPGNERSVANTIDNLFRLGADVHYGSEQPIHASGHAKKEDLQLVLAMVQPEYFLPIHGEYRHLVKHAELAQSLGMESDHTFVMEDGAVLEIAEKETKITDETVPAGHVLVDGLGVGDVGQIVLRDRQAMAKDGIFVVIMTVDHKTGKLLSSPDIISRGFVYMRTSESLIADARGEVKKLFARHTERNPMAWDYLKHAIRDELGEFLWEHTQRRPMVIPVVVEV